MTPRNVFFTGLGLIVLAALFGMVAGEENQGGPLPLLVVVVGAFLILGAAIAAVGQRLRR